MTQFGFSITTIKNKFVGVWYARLPTYYLLPDYLYFQIVNGWQTGTVLTLTETIKLKMTTKFGFVAAPFFLLQSTLNTDSPCSL